jgi:hypothetical protein
MPAIEDIFRYLTGVWRMMTGRPDGIRLLDLSADGFWNSFFAIAVALPALIVGWVGVANELGATPEILGSKVSILLRIAFVDVGTWLLPLALLGAVAPLAGVADRFVHYVVASNWASALLIWLMLPAALLRLFAPSLQGVAEMLSLALFAVSMALTWRLTNVALGKGPWIATAIFAGMFVASLVILFILQGALGLSPQDQLPAG